MSISPYQQKIILKRLEKVQDARSLSTAQVADIFGTTPGTLIKNLELLNGERHSLKVVVFYPDLLVEAVQENSQTLFYPRDIPRYNPDESVVEETDTVTMSMEELDELVDRAVEKAVARISALLDHNGYGEFEVPPAMSLETKQES